ncbi:MAG: hypothetical protein ACTSYT_04960 [Candidatus Asgardarchaeia archaeon]
MYTHKEFYSCLTLRLSDDGKDEVRDCVKTILDKLGPLEEGRVEDQVYSLIKVLSKIISFHRGLSYVDGESVKLSMKLLEFLLFYGELSDLLRRGVLFPMFPKKGIDYGKLNSITFSKKASTEFDNLILRKIEMMRIIKIPEKLAKSILFDLSMSIILISKVFSLESRRDVVESNDVKSSDRLLKTLFFKYNLSDIRLVERVLRIREVGVLKRLNYIKISKYTYPSKYEGVLKKVKNSKILENSANFLSRILSYKNGSIKVEERKLLEAYKLVCGIVSNAMGKHPFNPSKIDGFVFDRDASFLMNKFNKWSSEAFSEDESIERLYNYIRIIRENRDFLKMLSIVNSLSRGGSVCTEVDVMDAVRRYVDILEEPFKKVKLM